MNKFRKKGFLALWQIGVLLLLGGIAGILVNQLRPDGLPLRGDWSPEASLKTEHGESMLITLEEAERLCASRQAVFVDARSADAYREGHILCARNLPLQDVYEIISLVIGDIPPEEVIIVYCDGETCSLSEDLARELFVRGYENVRVLVNGWSRWVEAGLPTEQGEGPIFPRSLGS
ncbi:MAG: rhodanese-like domain-containing protein [Pseudomonadota bacterium]